MTSKLILIILLILPFPMIDGEFSRYPEKEEEETSVNYDFTEVYYYGIILQDGVARLGNSTTDRLFRPSSPSPWVGTPTAYDTGYCDYTYGVGSVGSNIYWPTESTEVSDRIFRSSHTAIDIRGNIGDPVYAAYTGVVVWAGVSRFGGGEQVWLAHSDSWLTVYAHLDTVAVECGQTVYGGQVIGQLGTTETSWPHLHFEIRNQRELLSIDPLWILQP